MDLRFMRTIVSFDLPTLTAVQRRNYRKFVKFLKKQGFIMLQESVYVKLSLNQSSVDVTMRTLANNKPTEGSVIALTVTEKQFAGMTFLVGDFKTDVINNEERYIEL